MEADLPLTRPAFGTRNPATIKFGIIGMLSVIQSSRSTIRAKLDSCFVSNSLFTPVLPKKSSKGIVTVDMARNARSVGTERNPTLLVTASTWK